MNLLNNITVIVYAHTVEQAQIWARHNIQGTNRRPVTASPNSLGAFIGIRNAVIIFIDEVPEADILYRVQGHGNILIKV